MKKLCFVLASFCLVYAAEAQFSTGQRMIGGQLSVGYSNTDINTTPIQKQNSSSVSLSPTFYKFSSPTRLNGFGLQYSYAHQKTGIGSPSEQTYNSHLIGAFVSQTHLQPLAKKLYFTLSGTVGANYQFQKTSSTNSPNTTDTKGVNVYLRGGIGLLYQLNQRFVLSTQLNNLVSLEFGHNKSTTSNGTSSVNSTTNQVGFSTGLNGFSLNSVGIGVSYLLK